MNANINWGTLNEHWAQRRLAAGRGWIAAHGDAIAAIGPNTPNAFDAVTSLMVWIDLGWDGLAFVRAFVAGFPPGAHAALCLKDYLQLRLIEGMLSIEDEKPAAAIDHFRVVLSLCQEAQLEPDKVALAHFWQARCYRMRGEYEAAMSHVVAACHTAASLGHDRMVALFQTLEGWIYFQQQNLEQAVSVLNSAEKVLRDTDDHVALGNILSGLGRIARREGRYEQALAQFSRSIEEYRKGNPDHRNIARSLAHCAYVSRLIALRLHKQLDADSLRRRAAPDRYASQLDKANIQLKADHLRHRAQAELQQAANILGDHHNHGSATVHIYRGFLHLDVGELDSASNQAQQAFAMGLEHQDYIIMARARLLQSLVETAKHEEGIEDEQDPVVHAQQADDFAKEAVTFARQTQNARLLAHACIVRGLSLTGDYLNDLPAARKYCDEAATYLPPGANDYLWEDYEALRTRILKTDIDTPLKLLSQSLSGHRTFQQITEDFADVIIPKVWEQEGYKVSAVVRRLSISPKKVRRILQRAGLEPPKNVHDRD